MTNASTSRWMPALWICFFALVTPLQSTAQDVKADLDEWVSTFSEYNLFNGSVLAAEGGEIVYQKGFGEANMAWSIPNTPNTRFRIGSVTKQFTAALILQLMEEGLIDLQAPITHYFDDYPADPGDQVTIHHLLTHTSGIPSYTNTPEFAEMAREPVEPSEFVDTFSALPLEFEPGSSWSYNNSAYYLLGVLIEDLTGMTYEEALHARLLDPFGLENTGYENNADIIPLMAQGYQRRGSSFLNAEYLHASKPYAAGMMYSTVGDLMKWTEVLVAGKPFKNDDTFTLMTTPFLQDYAYGLGVRMMEIEGQQVKTIAHSGGIFGFVAMLGYFPESERIVAVLDNTEGGTMPVYQGMVQIMHGAEPEAPRRPIGPVIAAAIESDGVEAGIEKYRRLKEANPEDYTFDDEFALNGLGYEYLEEGDVETAIAIFKLNIEMFPEAANPYDSLGEAYLEAGDEEKAIAFYSKALDLNPGLESAKNALEEMGIELEPELVLPADVLERYVGTYELAPNFAIEITREENRLFGQPTGQSKVELFPSSETEFYLKVVEANVSFVVEGDGPASSMVLHQGARDMPGNRVDL